MAFRKGLVGVALVLGCGQAAPVVVPPIHAHGEPGKSVPLPGANGPVTVDLVGYEPTTATIWIPVGETGSVDVFDTGTETFRRVDGFRTAAREVRGRTRTMGPSSVAFGPGFAYVGDRASNEVCPVDLASLVPSPCVTLSGAPDALAYVPSVQELWVTTPKDQAIVVLGADGARLTPKTVIKLDGEPEGRSVDDARGVFYTNLEDKNRTVALDVKTHTPKATWSLPCKDGPRGLVAEGSRPFLDVACTDGLRVLDATTGAVLGQLDVGDGVDDLSFVSSGALLYVAASKAAKLMTVHVDDKGVPTVVSTVATTPGARNAIGTPAGNAYVVDPEHAELLLFHAVAGGKSATYTGLGTSSVSADVLTRFAPKPLPEALARHVQALLDIRAPSTGRVGNTGKHLYFEWTITGISQLWRVDMGAGSGRFPRQLTGGEDRTTLVGVAPDDSYVLVARDRKGEENPGLYLLEGGGGPLVEIQHKTGVRTIADFISDDGRYVTFHANDIKPNAYAVYRWDRTTKQKELVFGEDGLWSVADWRPDGRLLLAKDVGSNMTEYHEYDPRTKKLTPLLGVGEREDYVASYGAKEGELLVLTPKLGEFRRLYRWEKGSFSPITPDIRHDVEDVLVDRARTHVFYDVNEDGYTRPHVLDVGTWKEVALPPLPPGDHVFASSCTRDGRYTVFGVRPGDGPLQSFVWDWKERKLTQLEVASTPEFDTARFARPVLESYPARDGTPIPMFVRRPAQCKDAPTPCPVLVSFHGGPEAQARPGFSPYAQAFVDAGFVFVEPNVRGSDGYGKKWLHADDGAKRLDIITDIEDASVFLRKSWAKNGVVPKIGILGGSYGGYSTLVGMTMFAGAYDAGASVVGISNLVTFLTNTAPYRRVLRASEYGDLEKDHDALVKLSPMTYVDRVKAPLFLSQGASDPRVPVGEALAIHDALERRGVPVELMIFADEGHGSQKRDNRALEIGHLVQFFEQHLR